MKETRPVAKHLTECLNFKKGIKYNLIAFAHDFLKIESFDGTIVEGRLVPEWELDARKRIWVLLSSNSETRKTWLTKKNVKKIYLMHGCYLDGKDIQWED
ncbi:hypothetical protein [Mycoplasmopsis gallinacea]|uniref:Uncharacterized protein n=1 Tax=Mycoplasmopsis gallinacea TaxID=29556 RepID=A0A449A2I5_9BACT|nr:hypothetical protein [Mycoplasmopsis gallinacea]VEU58413.1 Uncharacterised protein [Mycoplasmopsis gallinacea]